MSTSKSINCIKNIIINNQKYTIYDIHKASDNIGLDISKLPYSLRILFENVLRSSGNKKQLSAFKEWSEQGKSDQEIGYKPTRVLMQDFTGVPAIVDLASMRDAMNSLQDDPLKINPMIPVDLVIDHSVQVDSFGNKDSLKINTKKEISRNYERYKLLKWGQKNFDNLRVVPPGTGICHQVNLEYLGKTIWVKDDGTDKILYPDTLVGTDSHTTMINALSVLGWGVGGIEAEAAMLNQPLNMSIPEVVGFKLNGSMMEGTTATDLVLTITHMLRQYGVVGKFVEFFGDGLKYLSLADRATIANMSPEFGATCAFFPIDQELLDYLEFTGRSKEHAQIVHEYAKAQSLFVSQDNYDNAQIKYSDVVELDLSQIHSTLAGPIRPQDKVSLLDMKDNFQHALSTHFSKNPNISANFNKYSVSNKSFSLGSGDVVIAAITSCTNTSNPFVMIAAGLVAKRASELGMTAKPWVKTSLAPGSKVVSEYLHKSGLDKYLNQLGFNIVGYGCTTCIGNSGSLDPDIEHVINEKHLVVASVLSGNRNFEGRIHPSTQANYLASPPFVVLYALTGTINIDMHQDAIGQDKNGNDIFLKDLWPDSEEIQKIIRDTITSSMFSEKYSDVFTGNKEWQKIDIAKSSTYKWDEKSTYIQNTPYFEGIKDNISQISDIKKARILALFGDSVTTDHISPAGTISENSPASKYLMSLGVDHKNFNSYGSRRGNHNVMIRGTFANIRLKNQMLDGVEGGFTRSVLTGQTISIYDAAMEAKEQSIPLIVFAGKEYGTGSSRDWAAKGTKLLGIKAIIAQSFERIHRSNLVGMGVLPISFNDNDDWQKLSISGQEKIDIIGLNDHIKPYQKLECIINNGNNVQKIEVTLQVYTKDEIEYIKHGNILASVIKKLSLYQ